jgi:uncharacterized membrane protein
MPIPDFHPFVVHFPIALCSLGSVAGLLYLFWQPRAELRTLTWWPLLLGWIGALFAVVTGLLAQSNLPPTAPYRTVLNIHIYAGFGVAILYAVPLYRNWIYRNRSRKASAESRASDLLDAPQAKGWLAACFALGLLLVVITGAFGGQLVHHWGVNVQFAP